MTVPNQPNPMDPGFRLLNGDRTNDALANPEWSNKDTVFAVPNATVTSATKIIYTLNRVNSAPLPGPGVVLPQALNGLAKFISNDSANDITVFADGDSTIDGIAGTTGVTLAAGRFAWFYAMAIRKWRMYEGLAGATGSTGATGPVGATGPGGGGGCTELAGDTTFYVDAVGGNNANDGLTALTAWQTLSYAVAQMAHICANGYNVTILAADGTYSESDPLDVDVAPNNAGSFTITGTSAATILDAFGVQVRNGIGVTISNFTIQDAYSAVYATQGAVVAASSLYLDGTFSYAFMADQASILDASRISLNPTLNCTDFFVSAIQGSTVTYALTAVGNGSRFTGATVIVDENSKALNWGSLPIPALQYGQDQSNKTLAPGAGMQLYVRTPLTEVSFSVADPCVCTWVGHNLMVGDSVAFSAAPMRLNSLLFNNGTANLNITWTGARWNAPAVDDPIVFTEYTTGKLPAAITAGTTYYVKTYTNTGPGAGVITLAATPGGAAINFASTVSSTPPDASAIIDRNALPTEIAAFGEGKEFFVIAAGLTADEFQFSDSPGGTAVGVTGAASGQVFAQTGRNVNNGSSNYPFFDPQMAVEYANAYADCGNGLVDIIVREGYYRAPTTNPFDSTFQYGGVLTLWNRPNNCASFRLRGDDVLYGSTVFLIDNGRVGAQVGFSNANFANSVMIDQLANLTFDGETGVTIGITCDTNSYLGLSGPLHFRNLYTAFRTYGGSKVQAANVTCRVLLDPPSAPEVFVPFEIYSASLFGGDYAASVSVGVNAAGVDVKHFADMISSSTLIIGLDNVGALANSAGAAKYKLGDFCNMQTGGVEASLPGTPAITATYSVAG